jgi:hypothetical protein
MTDRQLVRVGPLTYAGIFVLAASVVLLEIALTRVFAITMWHHFAYMVVSIALLGFGAAGSILTFQRQGLRDEPPLRALSLLSIAYGLSTVAMLWVATSLRIDTLAIWNDTSNVGKLALLYVAVLVPFLLAGAAVGLALSRFAEHVNTLYFADLVGSALGGMVSTLLLAHVGSGATVLWAGGFGVLASVFFAAATSRAMQVGAAVGLVGAALVVASFSGGIAALGIPSRTWAIPYAPDKEFVGWSGVDQAVRLYSATAEVAVGPSIQIPPLLGGNFGHVDAGIVTARAVGQDGTAPTMLFEHAADLSRFPFLDDSQAGTAYVALAAEHRTPENVLVIGVGGGIDVMIALANGAAQVTAVEINSGMIEMVTHRFADYIGRLFERGIGGPGDHIELVHGEGRAFARRSTDRFDVVQLSGVDSFTALNTGAYSLAESYLYTTDAVKDLYGHLRDGGIINFSRFLLDGARMPRETLRLANIAATALRQLGIDDPASHLLVFQGINWASTMIKRGPFTAAQVETLAAFAEREGFQGLVFDPLAPAFSPEPSPGTASDATLRRYFWNVLRGDEAARRAFERDYPYDISATDDDAPFFFNYYRYSGLLRGTGMADRQAGRWDRYHADFPVGHMVLIASQAQIMLLALVAILWPVRALERHGVDTRGKWHVFGYFAGLGAGFMCVEIVLMQKLILFLGHPIYAVTVVLSSLLAFAGLGSLASARIAVVDRHALRRLALAVVVVLLGVNVLLRTVLPLGLGLELWARVVCAVVLLAPIGFVLGMPFPSGVRIVRERSPQLLPWAWAINGFLSVFASIGCITLSMAIGFSAVLLVVVAIYAMGFASMITWVGMPSKSA